MLTMTSRREINRHEREYEREKNGHMHTSGKAISVIKTDEKWIYTYIVGILFECLIAIEIKEKDTFFLSIRNKRCQQDGLNRKENNC